MVYSLSYFFAWLGDWERVVIIGLVLLIFLLKKGFKNQAWLLFTTVLLAQILSNVLKILFARNRPPESLWLVEPLGYSFPSGHATTAMALYGGVAYLLWKNIKNLKMRYLSVTLCMIIVLGIGLSRVVLRVHWFSDVLGGWILGLLVLICMIFFFKKRNLYERSVTK